MSDTAQTALGNPNTFHEYDDDGTAHDPMVVWDLSIGCTATVGFQGDQLVALVSTSDQDKRAGITRRAVTHQQVADYACQLLTLVGDPLPMAAEQLCDIRYALAGLQTAVLQLPVDVGGAACDDDYLRVVELAKTRIEEAGNPAVHDLAYRTMRNQRDEAIARANDAVAERNQIQAQLDAAPYSTGYPVGDKVATKIAEHREHAHESEQRHARFAADMLKALRYWDENADDEEIVKRAEQTAQRAETLHAGIRDWLTANSVLAFDDETPAETLLRHLNITANGYRERAEHDVERVARALFNRNHPGRDYDSDAGEDERELHRADARAAIEALKGGGDA